MTFRFDALSGKYSRPILRLVKGFSNLNSFHQPRRRYEPGKKVSSLPRPVFFQFPLNDSSRSDRRLNCSHKSQVRLECEYEAYHRGTDKHTLRAVKLSALTTL